MDSLNQLMWRVYLNLFPVYRKFTIQDYSRLFPTLGPKNKTQSELMKFHVTLSNCNTQGFCFIQAIKRYA